MLRCAPQSSLTLRACEFNWTIQHDDRLKLSLGSLPVPTALSRELLRRETRSQMADQSPGGDTPNFARNAASTTTRSALMSMSFGTWMFRSCSFFRDRKSVV